MRKEDDFLEGVKSIIAIIVFFLLFIGFGITGSCGKDIQIISIILLVCIIVGVGFLIYFTLPSTKQAEEVSLQFKNLDRKIDLYEEKQISWDQLNAFVRSMNFGQLKKKKHIKIWNRWCDLRREKQDEIKCFYKEVFNCIRDMQKNTTVYDYIRSFANSLLYSKPIGIEYLLIPINYCHETDLYFLEDKKTINILNNVKKLFNIIIEEHKNPEFDENIEFFDKRKKRIVQDIDKTLTNSHKLVYQYIDFVDALKSLDEFRFSYYEDGVIEVALDLLIYVAFMNAIRLELQSKKYIYYNTVEQMMKGGESENSAIHLKTMKGYSETEKYSYERWYYYEIDINRKEKEKKRKERYLNGLKQKGNKNTIDICTVDLMSGIDFERFVCDLFDKLGYGVRHTKISGDQGVDIVATQGSRIVAIQTKCQKAKVGNSAVQEVVAGKVMYNANECMVVTNSFFTQSAVELARQNEVILWDRKELIKRIEELDISK